MLQAFHFGTVIENNSLKKISNTMHANNKLDQYCSNLKKKTITNKYFNANLFNWYVDT